MHAFHLSLDAVDGVLSKAAGALDPRQSTSLARLTAARSRAAAARRFQAHGGAAQGARVRSARRGSG